MRKAEIYKQELKNINTPEKAYLLGLFYSDGCLTNKVSKVTLHKNDVYLIKELQKIFPFFLEYSYTKRNTAELVGNQPKIQEDLLSVGVVKRKSTDNRESLVFPTIESLLYRHFIRGIFDGDGCIHRSKRSIKIEIGMSNNTLLNQISTVLTQENITSWVKQVFGKKQKTPFYKLTISATSIYLFREYLYRDITLYLIRKRDNLYNDKIILLKTCPKCGSNKTRKAAKGEIFCHSCKKRSQLEGRHFIPAICPPCPVCLSTLVKNGVYRYKGQEKQIYLCRTCNQNMYLPNAAHYNSNVVDVSDQLISEDKGTLVSANGEA